jgi:hypothetical protein
MAAKVRLTKLKELPDARTKLNIAVGFTKEGKFIKEPVVGERFFVDYDYSTSTVTEIIGDDIFRTKNSIYQWIKY